MKHSENNWRRWGKVGAGVIASVGTASAVDCACVHHPTPPQPSGALAEASAKPTQRDFLGAVGVAPTKASASIPRFGTCPEGMVRLDGGAFTARSFSPAYEPEFSTERWSQATLEPFCIDRTEVTAGAYDECMRQGACTAPKQPPYWAFFMRIAGKEDLFCNAPTDPTRSNYPVNCVTWYQARDYCKWKGKELPTDKQWIFAAQGKEGRRWPWGNAPPEANRLNACGTECTTPHRVPGPDDGTYDEVLPDYMESDGWRATAPVGSFPEGATPEGIQDLEGNVSEWTRSSLDEQMPFYIEVGSSFAAMQNTSSSTRGEVKAETIGSFRGFRCAIDS